MSTTSAQKKALYACMKSRIPVVLVGEPGVGKTAMMKELAEKQGYELITLVGSRMDSTDVSGVPKAQEFAFEGEEEPLTATVYAMPWWQMRILRKKKVILFLDEMSNTPPSVQASMLTLLQDREFDNGTKMPEETIVVGAMNPTEQAADGYELSEPTTNRICFIPWSPTIKEWKDGMLRAWGKKVSTEEMKWKQLIVRFIDENPSYLQKDTPSEELGTPSAFNIHSPSEEEVFRFAWNSRRSWDNLSKVFAESEDSVPVQSILAQGIVGFKAAAEFMKWISKNAGEMTPREALENPDHDWEKMSPNLRSTILREVVAMSGENEETARKVIAIFSAIADQGVESFGGPYMRELIGTIGKSSFGSRLKPDLIELAKRYRKISRA